MPYHEPDFLPWDGRRVPITFVGGYLGAGKTTAVNAVLAVTDRPVAVIVNDVGAVNVDAALIRRRHGDTIELTNGCICCTSLEEMGSAFDLLRSRPAPPDLVLVELSGIAEPTRVLPWGGTAGFTLDGLVVAVAADQLGSDALPPWVQSRVRSHIAAADLLLLTRTDLVGPADIGQVRALLDHGAPGTPVFESGPAALGSGALGRFLALGGRRPGPLPTPPAPSLFDAHETRLLPRPVDVDQARLATWLDAALAGIPGTVVRAKGLIETIDAGLVAVQVVGCRTVITPVPEPERQAPTDLVVISLPSE